MEVKDSSVMYESKGLECTVLKLRTREYCMEAKASSVLCRG